MMIRYRSSQVQDDLIRLQLNVIVVSLGCRAILRALKVRSVKCQRNCAKRSRSRQDCQTDAANHLYRLSAQVHRAIALADSGLWVNCDVGVASYASLLIL
jgi:hypothetical protein